MYNCHVGEGRNLSRYTEVVESGSGYATKDVPDGTTELALMANLLVSEGRPGKVHSWII